MTQNQILDDEKEEPPGGIEQEILAEQVRLLFGQIWIGVVVIAINAVLTTIVLWPVAPPAGLIAWAAVVIGVAGARAALGRRYAVTSPGPEEALWWERRFCALAFSSGLAWGSLAIFFFPETDLARQLFITFVLAGMGAGSVAINASVLRAYALFVFPALVPVIIRLMVVADVMHLIMAFMGMLFLLGLSMTAFKMNRAIVDSLRLAVEMRTGRERTDGMNQRLMAEIDEREKAEVLLRQSEERYRRLVDLSPEGVMVSVEGKLIFINRAGATTLKVYDPKSLIGKPVLDLMAPESHDLVLAREKIMTRTGGSVPLAEERMIRADGTKIEVESISAPIDYEGAPSILTVFREITLRKKAEESLRRNEERLALAQKIAHLGSWDWDLTDDRFHWSDELKALSGVHYVADTELGYGDYLDHIHPHDKEMVKNAIVTAVIAGAAARFERRLMDIYGKVKVVEETIEVFCDTRGEAVRLLGAVHDVTRLKETERELREAKERAEEATKLKDTFVSIVAHDLKAPFASITGFLDIMSHDQKTPLAPHHQELVDIILASSENMVEMIDQLLGMSRLRTGALTPTYTFFDSFMAISLAVANVGYVAKEKEVTIVNEVEKGTRVRADYDLFSQVASNLISNALKFCVAGDTIHIRSSVTKEMITFEVEDSGAGIDPEMVPDLFRHDVKTSLPGAAGEKGTGLGLPYCYDVMAAMSGDISVTSELRKGTTVTFRLPAARPTILLVEDQEMDRNVIGGSLADMGAEMVYAVNGQEAIDCIQKGHVDLALVDIVMPVMNGLEFIKLLRTDPARQRLPVIVMTADESSGRREEAMALGAQDFVDKPIRADDLIPRVRRFIG